MRDAAGAGWARNQEDLHRPPERSQDGDRALFDSTPDGICVTDGALRFRRINRSGAVLLGMPDTAAMAGKSLRDLLAVPEAADEVEKLARRLGFESGARFLSELERHTTKVRELFLAVGERARGGGEGPAA